MEICSWQNFVLKKDNGLISKYSNKERAGNIVPLDVFQKEDCSYYAFDSSLSNNFMEKFIELFGIIPKAALMHFWSNENSEFADITAFVKNVYLSFHVTLSSENVVYSISVKDSSDNIFNSLSISQSRNVYSSRWVSQSYNIFYSSVILDSYDIWYCTNCIWSNNCINCSDLTNQQYMINNIQYTKDEYISMRDTVLLELNKDTSNKNSLGNIDSDDVLGIWLIHCIHVQNWFFATNAIDSRNIILTSAKELNNNAYDLILWWWNPWEWHYYGWVSCGWCTHTYCSIGIAFSSNCYYSYHLESCSFCLWCIGLKNKSYCILNKQYTKEERYTKVDEIFTQMEQDWQLWEFFPASMNPFYFNDTAAYLIDNSFTKEEVMAKWYLWRDEPIKVDIPEWAKVVKTQELDQYEWRKDTSSWTIVKDLSILSWDASTSAFTTWDLAAWRIRWIDPEILKVIIQDDQGNVYKIVKMEYDFLMKYGLPLPRKHRLDRMKDNFKI